MHFDKKDQAFPPVLSGVVSVTSKRQNARCKADRGVTGDLSRTTIDKKKCLRLGAVIRAGQRAVVVG